MREIMFRGKRVDNGEWVEGYYVKQGAETYIFVQSEVDKGIDLGGYLDCCQMYEVIPETVGQYIGLKDEKGVLIFEGDILSRRKYLGTYDLYEIGYEFAAFCYREYGRSGWDPIDDNEYGICPDLYEVLGNIHDNPGMLKS
jgi:uncharacterized phage protein (TIGR01671 family)